MIVITISDMPTWHNEEKSKKTSASLLPWLREETVWPSSQLGDGSYLKERPPLQRTGPISPRFYDQLCPSLRLQRKMKLKKSRINLGNQPLAFCRQPAVALKHETFFFSVIVLMQSWACGTRRGQWELSVFLQGLWKKGMTKNKYKFADVQIA